MRKTSKISSRAPLSLLFQGGLLLLAISLLAAAAPSDAVAERQNCVIGSQASDVTEVKVKMIFDELDQQFVTFDVSPGSDKMALGGRGRDSDSSDNLPAALA